MMPTETLSGAGPRQPFAAVYARWLRVPAQARLGVTTAVLALLVYVQTAAPDLTWAHFGSDGGELITAAVTLGVPHPPGYPLYVLLGKLFSLLPLGTVAFRLHLLSAVGTAAAAGFVAAATLAVTRGAWMAGLAAGLALAFAPLVWSQALIAEVYGLNLLLAAAFLWSLLSQRPSWLAGLLLGLSVTTHLTSLLLLPLAVALTPRSRRRPLLLAALLGLAPLLALPLLARGGSPVVWGDPTTLRGWWWLVSAQIYRPNLTLPATDFLPHLETWSLLLARQFAWLGLLLLPLATTTRAWRWRREGWLLLTAALYVGYALLYNTADAAVHLLPALLLLYLALAHALARIGYAGLLLPLALLLLNYGAVNLRHPAAETADVRALTAETLTAVPRRAIVLTPGDRTIFTLWYFQHVEGWRPDVVLVDRDLFAFDWYRRRLQAQYPDVQVPIADDLPALQRGNAAQRPWCTLSLAPPHPEIHCGKDVLE